MYRNRPKATLDFETRSAASLKLVGPWMYSKHPSTEILCLVYRLPMWEEGKTALWHPAFARFPAHDEESHFQDFLSWIDDGGLVEAHNVWFEYCIWGNVLVPRYGVPAVPLRQWRCTAAKASANALPRGLDDVARVLRLSQQKDAEGSKVMMKMAKPRKSRKAEREGWEKTGQTPPEYLWWETPALFQDLIAYCRQDVLTEEAVSAALPDLTDDETEVFLLDLETNARGFQLDGAAVTTALSLLNREDQRLNQELQVLTKGAVTRATQRSRMLAWCAENGFPLSDTQKDTIDGFADVPLGVIPQPVRQGLTILRELGRSSTAKYRTMQAWADPNDYRVRGALLYHGATTGRFSGRGVQPHNFPKGLKALVEHLTMDQIWATLKTQHRRAIQLRSRTSVMEVLSTGLRGAIVASPGHELFVVDYSTIEARVVLWLAGATEALEIFETGRDIYLEMAQDIYGYPCTKKGHPLERQVGKTAVLGLGFQMGAGKFHATCQAQHIDIDEDLADVIVKKYRAKFWEVPELWAEQQQAAMRCVQTRKSVEAPHVRWYYDAPFLRCELPSGRTLAYPFAEIRPHMTSWGETRPAITFMGFNTLTRQWQRQATYGGMLVENITQAVARDLMAAAMIRLSQTGVYQLVLSVHDELVSEAKEGQGSLAEYEGLMTECPDWATGCPVAAEGWVGTRYRK